MTSGPFDEDSVGYKKPPLHSRFRPGQSGNPRGRQKGLRNLSVDVKRTLQETIKITEQGRERRVSVQEAALMRLKEKALKGDSRALDRLLALAHLHNGDATIGAPASQSLPEDDQAILDDYVQERAREMKAEPESPAASPDGATSTKLRDDESYGAEDLLVEKDFG